MAHEIGTVTDTSGSFSLAHYNMLEKIRRFAMGYGDITNFASGANTGNGTVEELDALPGAIDETWTLECTAEAIDGGTFSVTGSVTGATADATVGDLYNNGYVEFRIVDGSTDFDIGDSFSFDSVQSDVSANGENWLEQRYDTSTDNHEVILMGEGFTGNEEIYVGFRTYQDAGADYYNLVAAGFTGYQSADGFDYQPGAMLSGVPAHNLEIKYWLSLNAQHIKIAMKVGTPVYESAYVGKFSPYARPSQFPYPVVAAGMLDGTPATRFSNENYTMPYRGDRNNMRMRDISGNWQTVACYPWSNNQNILAGDPNALRDTGGYYPLMPVELFNFGTEIYGALDGIYFISGFDNTVENTLTINGVDYIVIQDVYRTGFNDYYAMRMDT